jgi:hypothetical protein
MRARRAAAVDRDDPSHPVLEKGNLHPFGVDLDRALPWRHALAGLVTPSFIGTSPVVVGLRKPRRGCETPRPPNPMELLATREGRFRVLSPHETAPGLACPDPGVEAVDAVGPGTAP